MARTCRGSRPPPPTMTTPSRWSRSSTNCGAKRPDARPGWDHLAAYRRDPAGTAARRAGRRLRPVGGGAAAATTAGPGNRPVCIRSVDQGRRGRAGRVLDQAWQFQLLLQSAADAGHRSAGLDRSRGLVLGPASLLRLLGETVLMAYLGTMS